MLRTLLSLAIVLCLGVGVADAKHKKKPTNPTAPVTTTAYRETFTAEQVFRALDANSDKTLTLDEYLANKNATVRDRAAKAFKAIDKEGKGLKVDQFRSNFDKLSTKLIPVKPPKAAKAPPPPE